MRQGEVYWHTFAAPDKRRPVLILTRSVALDYLSRVVVAGITSTVRDTRAQVLLTAEDGMPSSCAVSFDNVFSVPIDRLTEYITTLPRERMREVRAAIEFALGFREMSS